MSAKLNAQIGPQTKRKEETKNKVLVPALGVASLLGGLQMATQYFAHSFGYQSGLGGNLAGVYPPWGILQWAHKWYGSYPDQIMEAGSLGMLFCAGGLLVAVVVKGVQANSSKVNRYLHGSARWATHDEIIAAGLLPPKKSLFRKQQEHEGVYVGAWEDKKGRVHYLRHNGPEHVCTYAPTRSGKGVGLVIPTLLSWKHSALVTDLKGELWALTAGWRQKHANNVVLKFEPAAKDGVCWNPLDEVRLDTEFEVGDVQNLATLIVDPDGKGLVSHWEKTAFALLVGVILHALYKAKHEGGSATLPGIDAMLSDPNRDVAELWMEMITFKHLESGPHPVIAAAARDMLDRPEEEAGSVLSTAKSDLALYRDPVVAKSVSESHFSLKDLMHNERPVTLYIVTQPNDKSRLKPLVRIMVNMALRLLADRMEFENGRPVAHYKHRLLMMLDEFPSLGKLEIMQESLAFVAGYGIKCYLICQDINQLKSRETGYGQDEAITSNCHIQNAYPPNRIETAEHLSRLTGQATVVKESVTVSGKRGAFVLGQVSKTHQELQRPLLTPDECLRMPGPKKAEDGSIKEPGDMVIYAAGYPAIYGKQILYFKDPVFQARASVPAPSHSDRLKSRPVTITLED